MLLKSEIVFRNMIKSVERQLGADAPETALATKEFEELRQHLKRKRTAIEKVLADLAVALPVHDWWTSHRGMGAMGLAQILGVTGDLRNFSTPSKLWKFLSLHVVGGRAAHRVAGAGATEQAFSPIRRSLMHQIGEAVLKQNKGAYKDLYNSRKEYELTRLPDVDNRQGWAHKRALRYLEKRILLELWKAWRKATTAGDV